MLRYAVKRILLLIPMLLAVIFFIFLLIIASPSSPGRMMLGPMALEEDVNNLNATLGFTGNVFEMYYNYIKDVVQGNFGISYVTRQPVLQDIADRWPATIILAFTGLALAILIGVPMGLLASVKHNSWIDKTITVLSICSMSMPAFWLAVLLLMAFGLQLSWFPIIWDGSFKSYILPAVTLGITHSGAFMRFTRSSMLDIIRSDFIKTTRAKGASEKRVILMHAFKNASLMIITITGSQLGGMLGGSVVVENIFAINGVGRMALRALRNKDIPQIMASTVLLSAVFILIMLLVDFIYAFIDPRIKARYKLR